jgi:hypothetical protein
LAERLTEGGTIVETIWVALVALATLVLAVAFSRTVLHKSISL